MNALDELMRAAEQAAQEAESWADLSNALFNPVDGLVSRAYRTREAREAFVKTEEYRKIRQLVSDAIERFGLVEGATPKKSGRFVVRLPQSLHGALEREAVAEGVSLNQLVVSKLSLTLGRLSNLVRQEAGTGSHSQLADSSRR
ncbi:MAG TPA: toxin-antitoxin system HicB family antitoxin [Isosphaeraceae bacterium]|nr:toxin-antitoxin system HicB family antitoxin [Isosphaeraceae bacterium]